MNQYYAQAQPAEFVETFDTLPGTS